MTPCKDCGKAIVEFSKAHCIDDVWQHCKCRGCPKTSFGDYACLQEGLT